jgi:LysR family hydrogen peroxide-inducible transcriptional activator
MTVIPEMSAMTLTEEQQENLKKIKNQIAVREISLVVHKEYIRRNILNIILGIIADSVPNSMKDPELKQYVLDLKR